MPETPKELAHDVAEAVKTLEHEAAEGNTARTPVLLVSGITIFVAVIVTVLLAIAFTAYYIAR
jgi:hypothetical protein